jgi:hypothetical protein
MIVIIAMIVIVIMIVIVAMVVIIAMIVIVIMIVIVAIVVIIIMVVLFGVDPRCHAVSIAACMSPWATLAIPHSNPLSQTTGAPRWVPQTPMM